MPQLIRFASRLSLPLILLQLGMAMQLGMAQGALAQCPSDAVGCDSQEVDFAHRNAWFDDVTLDSGWIPDGAPVQIRVAAFLGGTTEVDLGTDVVTAWPPSLGVSTEGQADQGRLSMNYLVEIVAQLRFNVTVGGTNYSWEGDIPIPSPIPGELPRDLRFAAETTFSSMVLPGASPRPVTVFDDTDTVTVIDATLGSIVPVSFVFDGGFQLGIIGNLTTGYRTDLVAIGDALSPIEAEGEIAIVRPAVGESELGGSKEVTVLPQGTITYDGELVISPVVFIEVVGTRFDLDLSDFGGRIALPIVNLTDRSRFRQASVHVPLPDIEPTDTQVNFETVSAGSRGTESVTIFNRGEAELVVNVRPPEGAFSVSPSTLTVAPGASGTLEVAFAPAGGGPANGVLFLDTNDPDEPLATIRMAANGADFLMLADGGVSDGGLPTSVPGASGGSCNIRPAGRTATGWAVFSVLGVLGLVVIRRRRQG